MDRNEMKADLQRIVDSARDQLKKAEAKLDEAKKAGKDVTDDVVDEIEKAHKKVSSTLSDWWGKFRSNLDQAKDDIKDKNAPK